MRKFKLFNSSGKKGIMALEALIGTILSTIALIFIISQFVSIFFMNTPTNEQIVKDNMKSINEFIEFSKDRYKGKDCYTMLKLKNLENFQFDKKGEDNYFILISNDKISAHPLTELSKIKNKNLDNLKTLYKYKLKDSVKLILDKTDDNTFSFKMYGFGDSKDSKLVLNQETEDIILIPLYDKKILGFGINIGNFDSNQNILLGNNLIDNVQFGDESFGMWGNLEEEKSSYNFEEVSGFNLAYNPYTNKLFLSKSSFSNALLNFKNCNVNDLKLQNYDEKIKADIYSADFMNERIIFDSYNKNTGFFENFKFVWSITGIKCPSSEGKTCIDYLGYNYESLDYYEFLDKIKDIYYKKFNNNIIKLVNREVLSLDELENNKEKLVDLEYQNDKLFIAYDKSFISYSSNNLEENLKEYFNQNLYHDFNNFNKDKSCNIEECDYIGLVDNKIPYFYNMKLNKFVYFDVNFLVKDNLGNFYYKGNILNLVSNSIDNVKWSFLGGDNINLNIFDIQIDGSEKTIVLSDYQLNTVNKIFKKND